MTTFSLMLCSRIDIRRPTARLAATLLTSTLLTSTLLTSTLLTFAAMLFGAPQWSGPSKASAAEPAKIPARQMRVPTNPIAREKWLRQVELEDRIALGKELFHRKWEPRESDGKLGSGDGLGPLFNERSCAACHRLGSTGGGGPAENNVQLLIVGRLPPGDKWETTHLAQRDFLLPTATSDTFLLHRFSTAPDYERWRTERLSLTTAVPAAAVSDAARTQHLYEAGLELAKIPKAQKIGDGYLTHTATEEFELERPSFVKLTLEERNTTALFGAGLIDQVQEKTLLEIAEAQPVDVRGRVPYTAGRAVGRFGWKGQNGTLLEFNAGACAAELGLDTGKIRQAKSPHTAGGTKPYANMFNISKGIDVQEREIQAMTDYVASLSAPHRPDQLKKGFDVRFGEQYFNDIGCVLCHRRDVGDVKEVYSDLLLHDVGFQSSAGTYYATVIDLVGTGDPKRSADPNEFRTPPLWGVADSAPYLHDGRAATLQRAIELHGGQAANTVLRFKQLKEGQRKQLLAFLGSLRAPH